MAASIEKRLDLLFDDILRRFDICHLLSWSDLARIYHTVQYCMVTASVKKLWSNKLSELEFSPETIEAAHKDAYEQFHRTNKVFSAGNTWNDDEWSLVLLLRLDLEMVKDFFSYKQLPFPPLELAELCQKMKKISENSKNKKAFSISLSQMKKYSELPFVDIWFQADESDIYKN